MRKTIYCEDMKDAMPCKVDSRHTFQLHMAGSDKPHVFAADSEAEMKMWLDAVTSVMTQDRNKSSRSGKTADSAVAKPQMGSLPSPNYVNTKVPDGSVFNDNILYESLEPRELTHTTVM